MIARTRRTVALLAVLAVVVTVVLVRIDPSLVFIEFALVVLGVEVGLLIRDERARRREAREVTGQGVSR